MKSLNPLDPTFLESFGATPKSYSKGEIIFKEGNLPHYFFQILEGEVKMYSMNNNGKEIIQGLFKAWDTFGEPPLLIDKPYPGTAIAKTDCIISKISQEKLMAILESHPEFAKNLLINFACRVYEKATTIQMLTSGCPKDKILNFLNKYKRDNDLKDPVTIPFTRQQIADSTGLRVETVIRTLRKLDGENELRIINHKVSY